MSFCAGLSTRKGDTKAALDACKQSLERQVNPWTTLALARARALAGDHATAAATLASLAEHTEQFVSGYDRAAVYAALGRTDERLCCFRRSLSISR
jgi:hypothetical protein